jgi:hypothetical protein
MVEIAGGLVGKQQRRARGERAGDGHALLFAARQLGGVVSQAVGQADSGQFLACAVLGMVHARQFERGRHFPAPSSWAAGETPEAPRRCGPARPREGVFIQSREILTRDGQIARCRAFQPREQRHQRAFPEPEGPSSATTCPCGTVSETP